MKRGHQQISTPFESVLFKRALSHVNNELMIERERERELAWLIASSGNESDLGQISFRPGAAFVLNLALATILVLVVRSR